MPPARKMAYTCRRITVHTDTFSPHSRIVTNRVEDRRRVIIWKASCAGDSNENWLGGRHGFRSPVFVRHTSQLLVLSASSAYCGTMSFSHIILRLAQPFAMCGIPCSPALSSYLHFSMSSRGPDLPSSD